MINVFSRELRRKIIYMWHNEVVLLHHRFNYSFHDVCLVNVFLNRIKNFKCYIPERCILKQGQRMRCTEKHEGLGGAAEFHSNDTGGHRDLRSVTPTCQCRSTELTAIVT